MTVSRFSVAVDRIAKKGEERKADFVSCVAFSNTAQTIAKYCTKGKEIALQGHIQTGSYTNQDGRKIYTTDVVIDRVEFCGNKGTSANNAQSEFNPTDDSLETDIPF